MQKSIATLIQRTLPVLPVVQVERADDIMPIAEALGEGGIRALEITLRTDAGLEAIKLARKNLPDTVICAGTVTDVEQLKKVFDAGAEFVVTPGINESLVNAANNLGVDILPGVATPSELMVGLNAGLRYFKLFPAVVAGGVDMLKALSGPFPDVKFCPTGGLNANNFIEYLQLDNVFCVGGSWMIMTSDGHFQAEASVKAAINIAQMIHAV